MSWHYLQGQEAASWAEKSLDGAPVALLRLIPMPERYCSRDKQTECLKSSQFGTMFEPLMEDPGEKQLTLSLAVSPVKILARRVNVQELPGVVRDYGLKCCELLARLGLVLSSRKTARTCVPVDSAPSSKDLPAWGMTFDGACWELGTSVRLINGIESGYLLATPTATANQLCPSMQKWKGCRNWLLPIPTAACATGGQKSRSGKRKNEILLDGIAGGSLNPQWVGWLMGWPIGWTDLKPLEMDRFREWRRKHSQSYLMG